MKVETRALPPVIFSRISVKLTIEHLRLFMWVFKNKGVIVRKSVLKGRQGAHAEDRRPFVVGESRS